MSISRNLRSASVSTLATSSEATPLATNGESAPPPIDEDNPVDNNASDDTAAPASGVVDVGGADDSTVDALADGLGEFNNHRREPRSSCKLQGLVAVFLGLRMHPQHDTQDQPAIHR